MTNNFLVYQMLFFLYTVHCIPKVRREIEDVRENIRAQKAWQIIRDKTCLELTSSHNCTKLKDRFQHKMTIYLASKNEFGHSQLNIRLVRRKHKDQYTNLDAVVVVDPFPDAMYGHTVVVLLIKNAYTRRQCRNKGGIHYQQRKFFNARFVGLLFLFFFNHFWVSLIYLNVFIRGYISKSIFMRALYFYEFRRVDI